MPAGRPFGKLKYETAEELETGINAYFADCDARGAAYTLEGLAYSLNISGQTLVNYGVPGYGGKDENFAAQVARARAKVLQGYAEASMTKEGANGGKFQLVNNGERMGGVRYAERVEQSIDIAPITFVDDLGCG